MDLLDLILEVVGSALAAVILVACIWSILVSNDDDDDSDGGGGWSFV